MAEYTSILFDLDGNLLPMDMDGFIKIYFDALADYMAPYGYEKQSFIKAVWAGTKAMVKNDGSRTNEDAFWDTFSFHSGHDILKYRDTIDAFYTDDFNKARAACRDNPNAKRAVATAKSKADKVVLATNPLFPPCAVKTRLSWIGLEPEDFDYVTTYDNSHYCKPNPKYYEELSEKLSLNPKSTLMIGNDIGEDGAAAKAGFDVFITTDCVLGDTANLKNFKNGNFAELCEVLERL